MHIMVCGIDSDIGLQIATQHRALGDTVVTTSRNGIGDYRVELNHPYAWPKFERDTFDLIYYTIGIAEGRTSRMEVMQVNCFATHDWLNMMGGTVKPGGKLVVLTSGWGSIGSVDGHQSPWYRMSKAALNMAVAILAQRYKSQIWTLMQPGWVYSKMNRAGGPTSITPTHSATCIIRESAKVTEHFSFIDYTGAKLEF